MGLFTKFTKRKHLNLENKYLVSDDGTQLSVLSPDGTKDSIAWNSLLKVEVQINDTGPWGIDVWFVLRSNSCEVLFPLGASGCDDVINNLKNLPGFEIKGMNSTSNETFTCWERSNAI
ncbi:hypothetical protein [Marinicella sediminis]|uniref:hypothetical protein n=1 Tax=Marinicella sediminis TaxID=1792834 RepID=UPI0009874D3D|nr:hypothetical protein [Marinicella sediminis]